ncbi:hypothetical protein HPC49_04780 [Pyxidicoccus fallax]|uniref:Insecticide toxin TcdB middle/N-terminal domain-containing protein n=1 Tax=Pyxidicoccus fallax TaxID=394095 RepID=A0A848LGZ6_9BACT|nr:RHS repeat-associated core domain-containing protein [Pyxidicoccus fallax]NMO16825.1 hypothetical protein [Pyxidicoccus fallax]NPC77566.1 hypothetical protein [Pyxidicoccus fallax]
MLARSPWFPLILLLSCLSLARVATADSGSVSIDPSGTLSVSENGAATYSLPLEVPPGIGKATPQLSFVYSSQAEDGRMGVGWQLQGTSAISRCPATFGVDGYRGTISYDARDRYCLDGQRLINVSGDQGAAESVYRTELETWRRVKASKELCGSGPCSFTVVQRDGSVSEYATTADSRILAVGRADVRVWAIARYTDLNGNAVAYRYTQAPIPQSSASDGQYYVQRIDYASNADASVEANRSVRFLYGPRSPVLMAYAGGSRIFTRAVLSNVQTYVGEQAVKDMRLGYAASQATNAPRLTSLQECAGTSTDAPCLTPTSLTWQDTAQVTFSASSLGSTSLPTPYKQVLPADFNGDGRGDLAYVTADKSTLSLLPLISQGTTLSACATSLTLPLTSYTNVLPVSLGGDGRADLVYAFTDGSRLGFALYTPSADGCRFTAGPQSTTSLPTSPTHLWPMDVNGDGQTDVVGAWLSKGVYTVVTFLGSPTGFTQATQGSITAQPNERLWPAEINGDGMLDLVQVWAPDAGSVSLHLTAFLSDGRGFRAGIDTDTRGGPLNTAGLWPLDVNADGKTDLVQGWAAPGEALQLVTFFATGAGGFTAGDITDTGKGLTDVAAFWPMDANGDGRIDLVQAWRQGTALDLIVYRNIGSGFDRGTAAGARLASPDARAVWPTDVNGDGKTDLVQGVTSGGSLTLSGYFAQGPAPDLLATLTEPAGARYALTYLPMSDPDVYSSTSPAPQASRSAKTKAKAKANKSALASAAVQPDGATVALGYPYRQAPAQGPFQRVGGSRMQLVRTLVSANEPARNASTYQYKESYRYTGGLVDLASGRGWLGFRTVSRLDEQTGQRRVTMLNQGFPLTGTTAQIEYQCDGPISPDPRCPEAARDTRLSLGLTGYTAAVTATGAGARATPIYEVRKQQVSFATYSYGTYEYTRAKTFQYDAYGNISLLSDLGYVGPDGVNLSTADDVYSCARYDNVVRQDGWELGYLLDRKESSTSACTDFSKFNDATDFHLEHFTYTSQRNLATRSTYDNVNRVDLTNTYKYDAFGNTTRETLPGDRTTQLTYETTYNTYVATRTTPPNAQGVKLTRRFGYDPRFGVMVAEATPNGNVSVQCLDAFGRVAKVQGAVPAEPSGVKPDTNCVPAQVTGESTTFRKAAVVTLETRSRGRTDSGLLYLESLRLQSWTLSGQQPSLRWQRKYTDGLGRAYLSTAQEDAAVGVSGTCTNYDSEDRALRVSVPRYFTGSIACTSSSGGTDMLWTTNTYDVYGRATRQAQPAGADGKQTSVTTMVYPTSLRVTVTQAADDTYRIEKQLQFEYYNSDRKLRSMVVPSEKATSTFAYDRIGRLLSATDPATADNPSGVTNALTYDSLDRRTSLDNPDQNTTGLSDRKALALAYDATTGLLARTTDACARVTRYQYDPLGRVTRKELPADSGDTAARSVTYGYDDPAAANGLGERTRMAAQAADGTELYAYSYGYDRFGHAARTALLLAGDASPYLQTELYDPLERVFRQTFPDGATVERTFRFGNLDRLASSDTSYARFSDYTPLGSPGRVDYGNGARGSYGYAPTGELISQEVLDGGGQPLLRRTAEWNHLQQLTLLQDTLKPDGVDGTQRFTYTGTRLTEAQAPGLYGVRTLGFDAEGNLTRKDGYTFKYQAHRLMSGAGAELPALRATYDCGGNMKSKVVGSDAWDYTYDTSNRLVRVARNGTSVLSVPLYNDAGSRLRKVEPSGVETLYVTAQFQVTRLPDGTRELTRYITTPTGAAVAAVTTRTTGAAVATASEGTVPGDAMPAGVPVPGTLYFHQDLLGSTALTTTKDGALSTRLYYQPFGGVWKPGSRGPDDFRPKYQGRELDDGSGFYYFGARYYDPSLGRFLTPDTELASQLTRIDSFNRFAFALNDPVSHIDPTGHNVWESIVGIVVGVAEVALGVAVDVLSDGALEPIGGALIGAGLNGVQYSATHTSGFSWKQYGIQQGEGALFGLLTGGFGGEAEAGVSTAASEMTEEAAASVATREATTLSAESEGEVMGSAVGREVAEEAPPRTSGQDLIEDGVSSCAASFPAGTPVWLRAGTAPIESLSGGESLLSRNSIDRADAWRRALAPMRHAVTALLSLDLEVDDGGREVLLTTHNHPLWVRGRGWAAAGELRPGDAVATAHRGWAHVMEAATLARPAGVDVYNFEVEGFRSYFVGALGVWAHNPCEAIDRTGQGRTSPQGNPYDVELRVPESEYPESAAHIEDAQQAGHPDVMTINRGGAAQNRRDSLRGIPTQRGYDRDEYPPAMFQEGGTGADIEYIDPTDNRGSGSSFGGQLRSYPNGTRVWFRVVP